MKKINLIYWAVTAPMLLLFLVTIILALVNLDAVEKTYIHLRFPFWVFYPLTIFKLIGIALIILNISVRLTEWAYIGFVFASLFATSAHFMAGDNMYVLSALMLALSIASTVIYIRIVDMKKKELMKKKSQ